MSAALRVAVIGAGPAGFYAADHLLKTKDFDIEVELFDRLPTPWGLVRAGVAPDHPKIKTVTRMYEKTAALPGFRYHGNVEVGGRLSHEDVARHHHAVIYTVGAKGDRQLGIPGEDLAGSVSATDFVAWYNGHPDHRDDSFDLQCRRAVVVGNGNVAVDVARMLVLDYDELASTDIADHALEALKESPIEEVVILGRRGPAQAAYTTPELLELGELHGADVVVDPQEAEIDDASRAWLESDDADPTARRNVETTSIYAAREPAGKPKRVVLRFLVSPLEIIGEDRVEAVRIVRNELVPDDRGGLRARPTEAEEVLECGLILRSVGYRGVPIPGVPFDEKSWTILNEGGRVLDPETRDPLPGVYTAGWIKRGPSGVIGTNKKCSNETVGHVLEDARAGRLPEPAADQGSLDKLLADRQPDRVDYAAWQRIDEHERQAGEAQDRPRVKLTRVAELIECAGIREGATSAAS